MSLVACHSSPVYLRTSLYQYLPGVFHRGLLPTPPPWQRVQDHESVVPQRQNPLAVSALAPSTSSRGSARSGTTACAEVAVNRPTPMATAGASRRITP